MPAMIRKYGKAEKIAHEILGTPLNMPERKYRAYNRRKEIRPEQEQMHPLIPATPDQVAPNSFFSSY